MNFCNPSAVSEYEDTTTLEDAAVAAEGGVPVCPKAGSANGATSRPNAVTRSRLTGFSGNEMSVLYTRQVISEISRSRNQTFAAETTENIGFTRRSLCAGCSPGNRSPRARHLHARLPPSPAPAARYLNTAAPPARIFPAHFRPQPVPAKPPATCRAEVWTLPSRSRFSEEKPSSPQAVRPAAPPAQRSTPS